MSSGKDKTSIVDLRARASERQGVLPRIGRVPEAPKRQGSLRTRRRKMRAAIAVIILLLIAALSWAVSWASYRPQFTIHSIEVVGAKKVPAELIQQYMDTVLDDGSHHFFSRRNIFVYPRAVLEKAIVGNFPRIQSAKVSRPTLSATTVIVHVEEREPYALWCMDAGAEVMHCYTMDDGGFIFAEYSGASDVHPATPYIFHGGITSLESAIGQRFAPGHLTGLVALLGSIGQAGFNPQAVSINNEQDLLITLGEGFVLKASFGQDASALMKNLQLVLSSEPLKGNEDKIEYIDLRFNNRVYYKLKGEQQQTAG